MILSSGLASVLWLEAKKRWQVPDSVIWWKTYAWPWAWWFSADYVSRTPWTDSRENANTSQSANTTSSASCRWLGPISSTPEEGKENFQKPSYVTFAQCYKLTQPQFVFFVPMNMIWLNGNYSAGNRQPILNPKLPEIRYSLKEFVNSIPVGGMILAQDPELKKPGIWEQLK